MSNETQNDESVESLETEIPQSNENVELFENDVLTNMLSKLEITTLKWDDIKNKPIFLDCKTNVYGSKKNDYPMLDVEIVSKEEGTGLLKREIYKVVLFNSLINQMLKFEGIEVPKTYKGKKKTDWMQSKIKEATVKGNCYLITYSGKAKTIDFASTDGAEAHSCIVHNKLDEKQKSAINSN